MKHELQPTFRRLPHPGAMLACVLLLALFLLLPEPAFAADNIFGGRSPLQRFITFITGIFAYMLVIVGLIVTLGGLILGSDMSGFSRRAPLVVVSGAVLILADIMVGALFGAQGGYELPAFPASPVPPPLPVMAQTVSFPWTGLDLDGPLGPGFALVTGPGAVLVLLTGLVATGLLLFRKTAPTGVLRRGPLLVLAGVVLLLANIVADSLFINVYELTPEEAEALVPWSEAPPAPDGGAVPEGPAPVPQTSEQEQ